jgi:protein SCO1
MVYLAHKTVSMLQIALLANTIAITGCSKQECNRPRSAHDDLPYYDSPDFTSQFFSADTAAHTAIKHVIAPFSLYDQDGSIITNTCVAGKIHVANFFFSSCAGICPVMTGNMKKVHDAFEDDADVMILSYSVMPWQDSIRALKKFAVDRGIDSPQWRFVTGPKAEIYDLARTSYFAEQETGFTKDSSEFLHTEHFILVDVSGRIRGIYDGTMPVDVEQLIADIETLKQYDDPQ